MTADLDFLTVADAARLIATKQISPVELTEAKLRRIASLDAQLHAFVTVTPERALAQARAAEREILAGRYRGPLHGIPVGLKDIYDTAGIPTTAQSRLLMGNVPVRDATATSKLYEAGAVLLGKLTTHEFAHGGPSFDLPWPPARNPWDLERITGGSSTGSAAAVAAGLVIAALGSDTGGSIRLPAALCGIAGLKPTSGLVSRHGVIPHSYSFDVCGPMAWTAEDCALLLQAIAGHDPADPSSARRPVPDYRAALEGDPRGLRVGVIRHFWEEEQPIDDRASKAIDEAIRILADLGVIVHEARMRTLQDYFDVKIAIGQSELYAVHEKNLRERPGDFGVNFFTRVTPACLFRSVDYIQAQREWRTMQAEVRPLYEKYDVLLTACASAPAPKFQSYRMESSWTPLFTTPFNVTGGPALSVCTGFTEEGLPLSMQLAGRPFEDATVLKIGRAYERAAAQRDRRPHLVEGRPAPTVAISELPEGPRNLDPDTLSIVETSVARAGLRLTELQFLRLCRAAPHVLAMSRRLRRDRAFGEEPASIFLPS